MLKTRLFTIRTVLILAVLIIVIIALLALLQEQASFVCVEPYIKTIDSCCLDLDRNNVCDAGRPQASTQLVIYKDDDGRTIEQVSAEKKKREEGEQRWDSARHRAEEEQRLREREEREQDQDIDTDILYVWQEDGFRVRLPDDAEDYEIVYI